MIEVTVKYPGKDHVFLCNEESAAWLAAQFESNEWIDVVMTPVAATETTRAKEKFLACLDDQLDGTVVSKYATVAECNAARIALNRAIMHIVKL